MYECRLSQVSPLGSIPVSNKMNPINVLKQFILILSFLVS